jgi:hypothetical protein
MTATERRELTLERTEDFVVESTDGDLGWVEEVWVAEANEPGALAVRTTEGRHGLLLAEDVLAIDREYRWVVVRPEATLLELDSPRMSTEREGADVGRVSASWSTTGEVFRAAPRRRRSRSAFRRRRSKAASTDREPRLWRAVAALLSFIALLVVVVVALAVVIPWLVAGAAF